MDAFSPDTPDQDAPGPSAWLEPADGQSVTVQVIGRLDRRSSGGGWWYEVRLPVWAEVQLPGGVMVEPDSIVMRVPARLVTPIEGTDYSAVPTQLSDGHPERPTFPPPPRRAGETCSTCPRPSAAPGAGPSTTNRAGCPPVTRNLTLDQALRELTRPGSEPCTTCEAPECGQVHARKAFEQWDAAPKGLSRGRNVDDDRLMTPRKDHAL